MKIFTEAREAWTQISRKWADAPRGQKEGMEVTNLLIDAAKAAAEHTAAMRIPYEKEDNNNDNDNNNSSDNNGNNNNNNNNNNSNTDHSYYD